MSVPKEVISRYPLTDLSYILVTGLFTVISFPYAVFAINFSTGIKLPTIDGLRTFLANNYSPFVNLHQINTDFITGFGKIIVLGFVIGILFFIFFDIFEKMNHCIAQGKIEQKLSKLSFDRQTITTALQMEFDDWARNNFVANYLSFLYSIKNTATGLLYAAEFGLVYTIFPIGLSMWNGTYFETWLNGFLIMLMLFIFSLVLHLVARRKFQRMYDRYFITFSEFKKFKENEQNIT